VGKSKVFAPSQAEALVKPIVMVYVVVGTAIAACAPQQQGSSGARSADQLKQEELKQMETKGQRNDFDKIKVN
jgi:hypothetical protein